MYPKGKDSSHPRGSHFLPWRGRHRSKGGGSSDLPIQPKRAPPPGEGTGEEHPSKPSDISISLRSSRPIPRRTSRTIKSKQQTWKKRGKKARRRPAMKQSSSKQAEIMGTSEHADVAKDELPEMKRLLRKRKGQGKGGVGCSASQPASHPSIQQASKQASKDRTGHIHTPSVSLL